MTRTETEERQGEKHKMRREKRKEKYMKFINSSCMHEVSRKYHWTIHVYNIMLMWNEYTILRVCVCVCLYLTRWYIFQAVIFISTEQFYFYSLCFNFFSYAFPPHNVKQSFITLKYKIILVSLSWTTKPNRHTFLHSFTRYNNLDFLVLNKQFCECMVLFSRIR